MKPFTYALVYTSSGFIVMYYEDWKEYSNGCVIQTSDFREQLEIEAEWRNLELDEPEYDSAGYTDKDR